MKTHPEQQSDNFKRILKLVKEKDRDETLEILMEIAGIAHHEGIRSIMTTMAQATIK